MNDITKKIIYAFVLSFVIFAVAALLVGLALSLGRGDPTKNDPGPNAKHTDGDSFNLLLILTDYRPEKFADYSSSDTEHIFGISADHTGTRRIYTEDLLLVRFDTERGELTLTPIPRKALVDIKGERMTLENLAGLYGTELLIEKVRALTGMEIDSYAVFTPESAADALDMIGEFKYKVRNPIIWEDKALGIDINIQAGTQKFDGKKTVDVIRYYGYPSTYIDKNDVLIDFFEKILKNLTDDFTYDELCGIMSSISERAYGKAELTREQIKLLGNSDKLDIKLMELCGSYNDELQFIIDEKATLEAFKPYRRIYS